MKPRGQCLEHWQPRAGQELGENDEVERKRRIFLKARQLQLAKEADRQEPNGMGTGGHVRPAMRVPPGQRPNYAIGLWGSRVSPTRPRPVAEPRP